MRDAVPYFRKFLVAVLAVVLVGCGFHLRGLAELSFKTIYVQQVSASGIAKDLRRSLTGSGVQVVPTAAEAEMLLELMRESTDKRILSLSGGGKVREYELIYRVEFRMREASSEFWGEPQSVEVRRDYSYDDTQLLAKEGEEARLSNDMRTDASREIMRRLNSLKTGKSGTAQ
jgi:LPS-assembly lipoprotein